MSETNQRTNQPTTEPTKQQNNIILYSFLFFDSIQFNVHDNYFTIAATTTENEINL